MKKVSYFCDLCCSSFHGKGYLQRHIESRHLKYTCNACNATYIQKRGFLSHLRSHFEQYICAYCGISVFKLEKLQSHINSEHEPHNKKYPYQCRYCVRNFPNAISRNCHENEIHKNRQEPAFACNLCNITFTKRDELRLHFLENHYKGSLYFCVEKDCDRYFKSSKLLQIHENVHKQARYQCQRCKTNFKQSANLSKHKKRCKGVSATKPYSSEELTKISDIAKQQFIEFGGRLKTDEKCKKIQKTQVDTQTEVFEEKKEPKLSLDKASVQKKTMFQCDLCGIDEFCKPSKLRKHILNSHMKSSFKCSEVNCDKSFRFKGNMVKHIAQVHKNERNFQCDKCGNHLKTKQHLKSHLKIHEIPKPCPVCDKILPNVEAHLLRHRREKNIFNCQYCNKPCATKQALQEHVKRIHEKKPLGRLYKCSVCSENFIRNVDLRRHSFIHFQGKVYSCSFPECIERFKTAYKLKLHQVIHNRSAAKNFVCNICNKSYPRQTALYKHRKQHHLTGKITHTE